MLVLVGAFGVACDYPILPATNPFDPAAPLALQEGGTIRGTVRVALGFREGQSPESRRLNGSEFIRVLLDDGEVFEPPFDDDGNFQIAVRPGNHTLRVQVLGGNDKSLGQPDPVEVGPGEEVVASTQGYFDGIIYVNDLSPPNPFSVDPIPDVVQGTSVTLRASVQGTDPENNVKEFQFRAGDQNWVSRIPAEGTTWTAQLQPNDVTMLAWRAVDRIGNVGPETFAFVRSDNRTPPRPNVEVKAGNGYVDLSWNIDVDPDVSYQVEYGPLPPANDPDPMTGVTANEGPSPVPAVGGRLRLSGLVNGARVFVRVRARDTAGNESLSETVEALPNPVTPEPLHAPVPVSSIPLRSVTDGETMWVLMEQSSLEVYDVRDPSIEPVRLRTYSADDDMRDIALWGDTLVVANNERGLRLLDVSQPDLVPLPVLAELPFAATPTEGLNCGGGCRAEAVTVRMGVAFVAVTVDPGAAGPFRGGVWKVDVRDPSAPVALSFTSTDLDDGLTIEENDRTLVGPVRVFGDYLAIGQTVSVPRTHLGLEPVVSHNGVLLVRHTDGQVCGRVVPSVTTSFTEVFAGDGILNPDGEFDRPRPGSFEVYGERLFATFDGAMVVMDLGGLSSDCDAVAATSQLGFGQLRTTATHTLGKHNLGLLTARSVVVAGGFAVVAASQRSTALPQLGRVDILSLEQLQAAPGAPSGVPAALEVQGRIDTDARGPLVLDGTLLTLVGREGLGRYEVFEPAAPRLVTAVGENPTGANVAMGNYVIHQRTLRGVGIWDLANPESPVQRNAGTCVPGCFDVQDLAGPPRLFGGLLVSAFAGQQGQFSVAVTDVATDVTSPTAVQTAPNPCPGTARGFALWRQWAFVGCFEDGEVHVVDIGHPEDVRPSGSFEYATDAALDLGLPEGVGVRGLVAAKAGTERQSTLFVLTAAGELLGFDLEGFDGTIPPPPLSLSGAFPGYTDLGIGGQAPLVGGPELPTFGRALASSADRLFVLAGRSVAGCDPLLEGDLQPNLCYLDDNRVIVLSLQNLSRTEAWVREPSIEPDPTPGSPDLYVDYDLRLSLSVTPRLVVLGRQDFVEDQNNYEIYRIGRLPNGAAGLAGPNPFPLASLVVGGHLVPASFQVYALE